MTDDKAWLTVTEAAELLGVSVHTVRRRIETHQLPASRASDAPKAPWRINAVALQRQLAADAERQAVRKRLKGVVVGRGDEFAEKLDETGLRVGSPDGPTLGDHWRELRDRSDLLDRIERDMYSDPAMARRFEELDEDEAEETEAHELARRIRRAERIRKRAEEILDADDD